MRFWTRCDGFLIASRRNRIVERSRHPGAAERYDPGTSLTEGCRGWKRPVDASRWFVAPPGTCGSFATTSRMRHGVSTGLVRRWRIRMPPTGARVRDPQDERGLKYEAKKIRWSREPDVPRSAPSVPVQSRRPAGRARVLLVNHERTGFDGGDHPGFSRVDR